MVICCLLCTAYLNNVSLVNYLYIILMYYHLTQKLI